MSNRFFSPVSMEYYLYWGLLLMSALFVVPETFAGEERSPYRILFSNDTTNIMSCRTPFNPNDERFREEFLRVEVGEAADADVQMLQPGLGWVPLWKSKLLPIRNHIDWLASKNRRPNDLERYVEGGGDLIRVFSEECRQKNVAPFVSLRVNDIHHVYRGNAEKTKRKNSTPCRSSPSSPNTRNSVSEKEPTGTSAWNMLSISPDRKSASSSCG